jgi:hypothetical protein
VKSIRGFHFYDIVSVDELLARLARDAGRPCVAEAVTELLLNSFYPQAQGGGSSAALGPLQAQRCLTFLATNETAALAFYSCFHKYTSVGSAVKMSVLLLDVLEEAVSDAGLVTCMVGGEAGAGAGADCSEENTAADGGNTKRSGKATQLLDRAKRRRDAEVGHAHAAV